MEWALGAGQAGGTDHAENLRSSAPAGVPPRGIPAASLKHRHGRYGVQWGARLPRGIPAASLKRRETARLRLNR